MEKVDLTNPQFSSAELERPNVHNKVKYRPEIDGLRAVAVMPVVLYHAEIPALSGGFAGVDVFFVISGFLITCVIAEEADKQRFSFLHFYERRARRILPALFLVMLASIPLAWATMVPYQIEDFAQSIVATMVFLSNVLFWFETDYFAVEADLKPLLHTWSLAVEEQFYVVFPVLLIALYRVGRGVIIPTLALAVVGSFFAALTTGSSSPSATFFLIQFRAWELLTGAIVALWVMQSRPLPNESLAFLGLLAILLSFFLASGESLWPGPLTLLPVLGSALVIAFSSAENRTGRALAWGPVRTTGLISYSLYLWHWPLLVFLNIAYFGEPPRAYIVAIIGLSLVLSWLSWRFVERPFRMPGIFPIRTFALAIVVFAAPLGIIGLVGIQTSGFQRLITASIPEELAGAVIDRDAEVALRKPLWHEVTEAATKPFPDTDRNRVLILGDSLSGDLIVATLGHAELFSQTVFRRLRLDDPCMPALASNLRGVPIPQMKGRCASDVRVIIEGPLLDQADEIVLAANWQRNTAGYGLELAEAVIQTGRKASILGIAAFNDMASLSMQLHEISEPIEIFLHRNIRSKFLPINVMFEESAQRSKRLRYLDKLALFCDSETCDMLDANGKPLIFDSAHVTAPGATIMAARIRKAGWFE